MINKEEDRYTFTDDSGKWIAEHPPEGIQGPLKISYKNDTLLQDCIGYCGSKSESSAVSRKTKDFHKGGVSVIETEGFLPFEDGKINYRHSYKYSNKWLRVVSDISFLGNTPIKRHFGLGSLFLPGKWKDIYVQPAAALTVHGAEEKLISVPKHKNNDVMLAHWHRPPLSVTFRRPNGTSIEIGTGSDLWRWEENLGYAPESGSYKIILEKDGIRFIREPLACCEDFNPENRSYKFSWYIAWRENGANKSLPNHHSVSVLLDDKGEVDTQIIKTKLADKTLYGYAVLDLNSFDWKDKQLISSSPYDFIRNIKSKHACWNCSSVVTRLKSAIRKLADIEELDGIVFKNFSPKVCYQSHHVNKKHENGTAHWDINGLFDFAAWASNFCKDKISLYWDDKEVIQPSLLGLFE